MKIWHGDEGWGVLGSPEIRGDVWAHFSAIEGTGYRELNQGDGVEFEYRRAHQEGYRFRAVVVRRQA